MTGPRRFERRIHALCGRDVAVRADGEFIAHRCARFVMYYPTPRFSAKGRL